MHPIGAVKTMQEKVVVFVRQYSECFGSISHRVVDEYGEDGESSGRV